MVAQQEKEKQCIAPDGTDAQDVKEAIIVLHKCKDTSPLWNPADTPATAL
jgi:hypothetical protein